MTSMDFGAMALLPSLRTLAADCWLPLLFLSFAVHQFRQCIAHRQRVALYGEEQIPPDNGAANSRARSHPCGKIGQSFALTFPGRTSEQENRQRCGHADFVEILAIRQFQPDMRRRVAQSRGNSAVAD